MSSCLIAAITGARNRGVEALLVAIIEGLRRWSSGLEIQVLTQTPDYDRRRLGRFGVQTRAEPEFLVWEEQWVPGNREPYRPSRWESHRTVPMPNSRLSRFGSVVFSGGDTFSSDYGTAALYRYISLAHQAFELGIPVVFHGQSLSPFVDGAAQKAFVQTVNRSAMFIARDSITSQYLLSIGVRPERLQRTVDSAFLLDPEATPTVVTLLRQRSLTPSSFVALCPSQGISGYGRGCEESSHLSSWLTTIRWFLNRGERVVLIPHVQEIHAHNDDRLLVSDLIREAGAPDELFGFCEDLSAGELKEIVRLSKFVVTERMHAGVAGLSQGVPVLSVGYSSKFQGVLEGFSGETKNWFCPSLDTFLNSSEWLGWLERSWDLRLEMSRDLAVSISALKAEADNGLRLLAQAIAPGAELP